MIENLSLTMVTHLDADVKRSRMLYNRIKSFERQTTLHQHELGYLPRLAEQEVNRLRKMEITLSNYDLINTNIKTQKIKKEINQWLKVRDHWRLKTGLDWITKSSRTTLVQDKYLETMVENAQKAKKNEMVWRLCIALEIAIHDGWYIIMNTLTVNTEKYNYVWSRGSKAFRNYIRSIDKTVGRDYHIYYCVSESGSKNNREHFHIIHLLKEIPLSWQIDPNKRRFDPTLREVYALKNYWLHGYSTPIAVRIDANDPWAKLGWRWPVQKITSSYTPISLGIPAKLVNYVAKYITKSLTEGGTKWKQRIRHQMGMQIINSVVDRLTKYQMEIILQVSQMKMLTVHDKLIPANLLKWSVHRRIVKNLKLFNKTRQLMTIEAQPSIMARLRTMTQTIPILSLQNTGDLPLRIIQKVDLYNIQEIFNLETLRLTGYISPVPGTYLKGVSNAII